MSYHLVMVKTYNQPKTQDPKEEHPHESVFVPVVVSCSLALILLLACFIYFLVVSYTKSRRTRRRLPDRPVSQNSEKMAPPPYETLQQAISGTPHAPSSSALLNPNKDAPQSVEYSTVVTWQRRGDQNAHLLGAKPSTDPEYRSVDLNYASLAF